MTRLAAAALLLLVLCGPGQASTLFRDEFSSGRSAEWSVLNENPGLYAYTSTYLDLQCSTGGLWGTADNLFLLDNPAAGDLVVTMRLERFDPYAANYHQLNLLAWDDSSNHVRCIYGHVWDERALEFGTQTSASGWQRASHTAQDFGSDPFYLRLSTSGNVYTQYWSTNGTDWTQTSPAVTFGDGTPARLGFVGTDAYSGVSRAHVDWFQVEGDAIPEPSTSLLTLVGLASLALARRRRRG